MDRMKFINHSQAKCVPVRTEPTLVEILGSSPVRNRRGYKRPDPAAEIVASRFSSRSWKNSRRRIDNPAQLVWDWSCCGFDERTRAGEPGTASVDYGRQDSRVTAERVARAT
jgi:hypothetical protein